MICPRCSNEIADGVPFCGYCGNPITTAEDTDATVSVVNEAPQVSEPISMYTPPVAPQPVVQQPVYTPPVAPVPKYAPQIAPKKKDKKPADKNAFARAGLVLVLILIFAGISALFVMMPLIEDTLSAKTISDGKDGVALTLAQYLEVMINGNRIFNPTILSKALGMGVYIFIYAVPVFALLAIIANVINKKAIALTVASSIISTLGAVIVAGVVPLSLLFIKDLKTAVALNFHVIVGDLESVAFIPVIIFMGIALVLTIASFVVLAILNKRRAK